ncbi:MAG TPA: hypothetical protein VHZ55_12265 [Bryobacteraceae bacterium]|jgi:hypothetical protein|nr:hypothetical protein [Bryobacteraceae bacterium]
MVLLNDVIQVLDRSIATAAAKHPCLLARQGGRYLYRLTDQGTKVALMFILFQQRVCEPLTNTLFQQRPDVAHKAASKIESPTTRQITPLHKSSISSLRNVTSDAIG